MAVKVFVLSFHSKYALQVHSAIGNCAIDMLATIPMALCGLLRCIKYSLRFYFHVNFRFHVRFHDRFPCLFLFPYPFLCSCLFKYGATKIYFRHGNLSINFQGLYEVARKLKQPFDKRYDG